MISDEFETNTRDCRTVRVLIAFLVLGVLSGCGGAWQPDRPDLTPRSTEGTGVYSPSTEDSRISL
ncbi:MAG TPA: hypothetical protein VGW39_00855 [Chthoniobacterales bacterium]|nr:hypothetical protein [Chthoniobacterales bacterium]